MNEEVRSWMAIRKITFKRLAELLSVSADHLSHTMRRRELVKAERDIIFEALSTDTKQAFAFWQECRRCGAVFERNEKEHLCPACAGKAGIKRELPLRRRKHKPDFTIREIINAAGRMNLSYGELVDKISRGLVDREEIEKLIKEK